MGPWNVRVKWVDYHKTCGGIKIQGKVAKCMPCWWEAIGSSLFAPPLCTQFWCLFMGHLLPYFTDIFVYTCYGSVLGVENVKLVSCRNLVRLGADYACLRVKDWSQTKRIFLYFFFPSYSCVVNFSRDGSTSLIHASQRLDKIKENKDTYSKWFKLSSIFIF